MQTSAYKRQLRQKTQSKHDKANGSGGKQQINISTRVLLSPLTPYHYVN